MADRPTYAFASCWLLLAKVSFRKVGAMITKFCPTKANVAADPDELEIKVIKSEAMAKLPRSQSFQTKTERKLFLYSVEWYSVE